MSIGRCRIVCVNFCWKINAIIKNNIVIKILSLSLQPNFYIKSYTPVICLGHVYQLLMKYSLTCMINGYVERCRWGHPRRVSGAAGIVILRRSLFCHFAPTVSTKLARYIAWLAGDVSIKENNVVSCVYVFLIITTNRLSIEHADWLKPHGTFKARAAKSWQRHFPVGFPVRVCVLNLLFINIFAR